MPIPMTQHTYDQIVQARDDKRAEQQTAEYYAVIYQQNVTNTVAQAANASAYADALDALLAEADITDPPPPPPPGGAPPSAG